MLTILGPCAAESEEQTLRIARKLQKYQVTNANCQLIFRAGVWKPRTSPETFQGVGDKGLAWLQKVKRETGLPVATEVSTPEQVQKALAAGIDYLWLGARTSANPILVQTLADSITTGSPKGIFIKNPVNEDAALWIGNIRRLQTTNLPIYAIHRGCSHRPCWEMAYRLRQEMPNIPLLLDPSHMSGNAHKVPELCQIAAELEYDGLMIEVHDCPIEALSDAQQQIKPEELDSVYRAFANSACADVALTLRWLRRIMDEVDDALWDTIARRMDISRQIGTFKKENNIAVVQPTRFEDILQKRLSWAKSQVLSAAAVREIMEALHTESVRQQVSLT